jgi:hypothetical protein
LRRGGQRCILCWGTKSIASSPPEA